MAKPRTRRLRAIILDRTKLGETDLILTMLVDSGAQVRVVAKGARKPGGKFAARCELFCEIDALVAQGKSLDILAEAQLIEPHKLIRGDYDRTSAASALCEIARLTCFEDSEDPFLYPILSRALSACEECTDVEHMDLVCAAYAFKVLAHGGWRPELSSCVECGDPAPLWFSVKLGGAVCESCARDVEGAEPVSPSQLAWISSLVNSTFDELVGVEVDAQSAGWLASLAHLWSTTHLDARLRAWEFMLGV